MAEIWETDGTKNQSQMLSDGYSYRKIAEELRLKFLQDKENCLTKSIL